MVLKVTVSSVEGHGDAQKQDKLLRDGQMPRAPSESGEAAFYGSYRSSAH